MYSFSLKKKIVRHAQIKMGIKALLKSAKRVQEFIWRFEMDY